MHDELFSVLVLMRIATYWLIQTELGGKLFFLMLKGLSQAHWDFVDVEVLFWVTSTFILYNLKKYEDDRNVGIPNSLRK